jgi:membrane protein DedA with SNARE-associated domain
MDAMSVQDISGWISRYGLVFVFLAPLLEIVIFVVPGETVLTLSGYLAHKGTLPLLPTYGAGLAGAICGISLSYSLGRLFGVALVSRYGRYVHVTEKRMARINAWYNRYGKWTLTIGYYVPVLRHTVAIVAGASRLSAATFALFAYPGALLWSVSFVSVGYFLGAAVTHALEHYSDRFLIAAAAAAALAAAFYFLWRRRRV